MPSDRGFKELPHTADRAIRVWAPDPAGLFAEAARGMYALMGARTGAKTASIRTFESAGPDLESLLVAFLSELIYLAEGERLAFTRIRGRAGETAEGWDLKVDMEGESLLSMSKSVKAATYHHLRVNRFAGRCEAEIVFDV